MESRQVEIRAAKESDFSTILSLIKANSEYLGKKPAVISVEQLIEDCLKSSPPKFYCLVCVSDNQLVGYTIYNLTYCGRTGKAVNIQDFYLLDTHRTLGQDRLLKAVMKEAYEKGCCDLYTDVPIKEEDYKMFWLKRGALDDTDVVGYHVYQLNAEEFNSLTKTSSEKTIINEQEC